MAKPSKQLLARIAKVTNKRARLVLDTIASKGIITTEDLKKAGYDHPPRAARDVRELGFALETTWVKDSNGRRIGAYAFGEHLKSPGKDGRRSLQKSFYQEVMKLAGGKCQMCGAQTNLQVDHRVPYEVAGESQSAKIVAFQVLCGSCNRTKSWACEHCENWKHLKRINVCQSCYWAGRPQYAHVAMRPERRVELVWSGADVKQFDRLAAHAGDEETTLAEYMKRVLGQLPE